MYQHRCVSMCYVCVCVVHMCACVCVCMCSCACCVNCRLQLVLTASLVLGLPVGGQFMASPINTCHVMTMLQMTVRVEAKLTTELTPESVQHLNIGELHHSNHNGVARSSWCFSRAVLPTTVEASI